MGPLRSLRTESTSSTGPLGSLRTESCSSVESFRGRQNSNSSGFGEKSRTGSTNSWARPSQSQQVPIVEVRAFTSRSPLSTKLAVGYLLVFIFIACEKFGQEKIFAP